jgi:hypothetical protein
VSREPSRADGGPPSTRRRGLAEAGVLAIVVGALLALLVAFPRREGPVADPGGALRELLTRGPGPGSWRSESLGRSRHWWIEPHPEEPTCVLLASEGESGQGRPRAFLRRRAAAYLIGGRSELFFRNYVLDASAEDEAGGEGPARLHVVWRPRARQDGQTARHVWLDARTGRVLRLEDRSYLDNPIRTIEWTSSDTGPLADVTAGRVDTPRCRLEKRGAGREPDPARVAAEAPFPVLAPTWLPAGYELVDARFRTWTLAPPAPPEGTEGEARRSVRIVNLVYSDGLGTLSLGIASPEDMDALERAAQTMRSEREAPGACPDLPEGSLPLVSDGLVVRRRRDKCRTVLRVDDLQGVSTTLLGRNEVPEDEYVRVVQSLEVVAPWKGPQGPSEPDGD